MSKKAKPMAGATWHEVRQSTLHGTGVFALCDIPAGTRILEYTGKRISMEQADAMFPVNPDDPFHTFFFALSSGKIIDGGQGGNESRWINHSCEPNCETQEGRHGKRVFVHTQHDIKAGEELVYDYSLMIDEPMSDTLKQQYLCLCGSPLCRGTMLALTIETESINEFESKTTSDTAPSRQGTSAPCTKDLKSAKL